MTTPVTLHAYPGEPRISVITVVHNGKLHVEQALLSVAAQTYKNIEHIIIDGGSTDGTLDIIRKHEDAIAYWVSEPDKGIYDAMNKGLAAARGEWIYFLGSDDALLDRDTIGGVARYLDPDLCLVFGDIMYQDRRIIRSRLNPFTLLHNTVHHQGAFYSARLFRDWKYDDDIRLIADYELNLKIYLEGMNYRRIDRVIAVCSGSGQSRENLKLAFAETNRVRKKYLSGAVGGVLAFLYFLKFKLSSG